ncbi:MAG: FecR domain-containing protein [Candidatus Omnitrophica bacterium]|nr:FecR domain-containing protein [Candidatus Omnitrophota bacterium]
MKRASITLLVAFLAVFSFQNIISAASTDIIIKEIKGLVQVQREGDAEWAKAEEASTVTAGGKVRSFLESSALLVFPNGSEFRLRENTSIDVKDISQNAINKTSQRALKLNLGTLHYKVPPKKEKATEFKIYSSTSIVGITGTEGVVTAKGQGKPSENILIEGSTYNTDDQGRGGYYQTSGNVYKNDGVSAQWFSADVQEESGLREAIDEEYVDLIRAGVTNFKNKRDEGCRVGGAEALIKQAFYYLEKREYGLVSQTVEQANASLAKAKKISLPDNLDEKITDIVSALDAKESEGYDVAIPSALLAKALWLKQRGEFGDIKQVLTQAEKELALLTDKTLSGTEGTFLSHVEDVERRVLEKGQQGFVTAENRALLRQARMFYELGEKPRAYLFLKEADDKLSLVLKNVSDAFTAKVARLEKEIAAKKAANYPTKEFELRLEKVKAYIKEENFLKGREALASIEEGLAAITKSVSADWQLKIADLKRNVNYKRTIGYVLDEIPGLIGEIEDYQAQGDLANLELTYNEAIDDLAKLKLPNGFEANWKEFLKQIDIKTGQGYNLKTVKDLSAQVQTAMDAGDIKSARTFLVQAKKTLDELKDQEPPKVQVISFSETEDAIKIEGYASDNTKIKNVSVNNSIVELTEEGKFQFNTIPHPSLKKLSLLATDIEGNISAPIVLALTGKGRTIDSQAALSNVTVEYAENALIVKGAFVPGGQVKIGDIETVCNADGQFTVKIKLDRNKSKDSIAAAGILSDDKTTEETILTIEDKWTPRIEITKVSYDSNIVPALNIEPLAYNENKLSVSGQVVLTQMANIEGRAFDLGGEIESLKIEGTDVDVRADGVFNASLTIDRSRKDPNVKLTAKDKSGNIAEAQVALDPTWNWPSLRVNDARTFQKSLGKFSKEIPLTADTTDIAIVLVNDNGETIVSKRLPVAAVLPPELEIQDIRYVGEKIIISGTSNADGTVSEKNKTLFKEDVQVTKGDVFSLGADYPPVDQEVILVAANIEGKLSEEVKVVVGPPRDNKAPILYLSAPEKDKKGMIVKGFVEDSSEIARLTVGGVAVEVSGQGKFSHTIESIDKLDFVEVVASDIFGNEAKKIVAFRDKEKPQITIDTWEAKDGRLVIAGKATDNIGIKQVRLNDMPIAIGEGKELAFSYNGALTADSLNVIVIAVDLMDNETKEGPRTITMPADEKAPTGQSIGMKYGSPIVYASGEVVDPAGVKAVYVNGEEVELFNDGTFNIKVTIDVGLPKLEMESPAYDQGKLIVAGKAAVGDFNPAKITVEAEDLSGNRGVLFSQTAAPYQLNELEVSVNGAVVDVAEDGKFRYEQPVVLGQRTVEIIAKDPFENSFLESQTLEDKKPMLSLSDLQYNADDETILLTGKAQDEGSGLYNVSVNGIRTDVSADGSFTYKSTFNQRSLNVVATDYIGNETSLTKEVKPPDVWAPVFSLSVSPIPAIVGNPVYVEIAALDSKTRLPEILKSAPVVSADADGNPVTLTVEGEGANYIATLKTAGLDAALVSLKVDGEDEAGNKSSETEGANAFALVADDLIAPSFTVETVPSLLQLGVSSTVKVLSSEDLKEIPSMTAALPSGGTNTLVLSKSGSGAYQASLTVPVDEGIGTVLLKLSGGEDMSGNRHDETETTVAVAAPVRVAELPLNINLIDFVAERFVLNGQTSSEAVVRLEAGKYTQDIIADAQGLFRFEQPISLTELEEMYKLGPTLKVRLKAHNYAGFESRQKFFEVALPPLPTLGAGNFQIRLFPSPAGQGDLVNFNVTSLKTLPTAPKGFLYLPGGQRILVNLQGSNVLTAQYAIPATAPLGTAMFEVVSGDIRESIAFDIVLSNEWMQRLNKYEFFKIRVSKDPFIIGEQAQFFVETMGDLPNPPRLEIRLPNGRADNIPLSGSKRFFQGTYISPADLMTGGAELILNSGMPEEIRRPYGIESKFAIGGAVDAFLSANPSPLIGGKPYDVNLSFPQTVPFKPQLVLKLQNGRIFEIPLTGTIPSNRFTARGTLPDDAGTGLAQFVLSDDRGMVLRQFPTQVSAPLTTTVGTNIFIVPDVLNRMGMATIQVNSITSLYGKVEAHISFPDGTKKVIPLDGAGTMRTGMFMVPDYVPSGMVTISVYNDGRPLGTINARVADRGEMRGPLNIFLSNPQFQPYELVKLDVETSWPLVTIPKAELLWEGGSLKITLTGQVPGNRFTGEFMAPRTTITRGRVEVRDAQGAFLGEFMLDRGPEGKGEVIVTPMPPVIGQPLSVKVIAPTVVNSAPKMRLIFTDGNPVELNAYGPIPGNTFTASLALLERPLSMIEIVHEGVVVESIPVAYLSAASFDFVVDVLDPMLMPCDISDVIVRSNSYVPFTPYLSVDFNGRVMDVPLSKISPTEFLGRMSVPCDVQFSNYNMRVFDPQGKLLWQRNFVSDMAAAGMLRLNVMPMDAVSVQLSWDMISGVDGYEIRYGETAALGRTAFAGNVSNYTISNLLTGKVYYFMVAARKGYQDIMVSNVINTIIGGTTLELSVNYNVMDNDVQLFWQEYPGADKYRVQWGTAVGAYPNMFDVSGNSYFIPDLSLGSNIYLKVKALKYGQVIGESRDIFVHIEEFMATGGEIYFIPDPPMVGQYLSINMHFFQDLPFVPNVMVRLQDRDVTLTPTGQFRDYETFLTGAAFDSPIMAVDVLDPQGRIIASRSPSAGTYGGAMVPVELLPDPPMIGNSLRVRVNFPDQVPFTPRLFVEYASGTKEYNSNQAPYLFMYEWYIPVADMNSSILYMKVVNPNTGAILGDRSFGGVYGDVYANVPFIVSPNPPIIGQPVSMTLNIDTVVSMAPKLKIYFSSGMQEVNMAGTLPGQYFTYDIGSLSSLISKIDIVDPMTNIVKHTWNPGVAAPTSCVINVPNDPPLVGQLLQVTAQFPGAISYTPKVRVYLTNGMVKNYTFPQGPGLSTYEISIPAADINAGVSEIEIWNDTDTVILGERFFGTMTVFVQELNVIPMPPIVGQSLQVHVAFNTTLGFTPKWRLYTIGNVYEGIFSQGSGRSIYDQTIPSSYLSSKATELEITNDMGNVISDGELFFVYPEDFTCTIALSPSTPAPYTSLTVTANYESANVPTYIPWVFIDFVNGGVWDQAFPQAAGMTQYSMTIPYTNITDNVLRIGVGDNVNDTIDCGQEFAVSGLHVDLYVSPDPPDPGVSLTVNANFSSNTAFRPELVIEFSNATRKYFMHPNQGLMNYQWTIPSSEITNLVDRIYIEDDLGNELMDDLVYTGEPQFEITYIGQETSNQIEVCWVYDDWIDQYKIFYGTASGNYNGDDSPVIVSGVSCYILGSYEDLLTNTTYYVKVEAYDAGNFMFGSQEEPVVLSTSVVEYPTGLSTQLTGVSGEIKVFWNNVPDVDGYRVYYGRNPQTYNESGSPLEINEPTATNAVIHSLFNDVLYYITVEAYIGTVESNNPNEVSTYAGAGSGGGTLEASPMVLNESGNAGSSIPQRTVTITNNGTTAANVRVKAEDLVYSTYHIPYTNYSFSPTSTSIAASGGSNNFTVGLYIPSGVSNGLYAGSIQFYSDLDADMYRDDGEPFANVSVSLTVSSVDHFRITADGTLSTMGDPIFVTLRAEDSSNNIVTSYDTSVPIEVSESPNGKIPNSWILSLNGIPGGPSSNSVVMYDGIGNFTVDAQEPEELQIDVLAGATTLGDPLNLEFLPKASGSPSPDEFAIVAPTTAAAGDGANDGALIWVAAVDDSGQVVTGYYGTEVSFVVTNFPSGIVTFLPVTYFLQDIDNGQCSVKLKDDTAGDSVTFHATDGVYSSADITVNFAGVNKYLVYSGSSADTYFSSDVSTIKFTLRAADSSDNIIRSYNEAATYMLVSGDALGNSYITPSSIIFNDGIAEFTLNNSDTPDTIVFKVEEVENNGIGTEVGDITVDFEDSGPPPEIVRVEMDTPWIVHVYFSEDIESSSGGEEANYNVAGGWGNTINKVCWYGDNVTLHLSSIPGGVLGYTFTLYVKNVKDQDGVYVGGAVETPISYNNIRVPDVDYQGIAGPISDWFEIQASDTTPSVGDTVHVTVYHKNVCGYLSGSNYDNRNSDVSSVSIVYTGTQYLSGSQPSSVSMSDGRADFDVQIIGSGGSVTISASGGSPTVNTTQIATLTIN